MKDVNTLELSKVARIFLRSSSKQMSTVELLSHKTTLNVSIFSRTPKPPELEIWTLSDQCPASNNVWTVEHPRNLRIGGFTTPRHIDTIRQLWRLCMGVPQTFRCRCGLGTRCTARLNKARFNQKQSRYLQRTAQSQNCTVTVRHRKLLHISSHIFTFARPMRPLRKDAWLGRCSHKV